MDISNLFKRICVSLGKSNKPTYAVMAIATVKGIARPTFTMMDKHEDADTKKYTAIREGLTEVVAIPTYWGCGELTSKIAGKLNLTPEKQALAKHNFMFLGVCTAALFVIPAVTSLIIKPLMKKIKQHSEKKEAFEEKLENKLDIIEDAVENIGDVVFKSQPLNAKKAEAPLKTFAYPNRQLGGMKVGAL